MYLETRHDRTPDLTVLYCFLFCSVCLPVSVFQHLEVLILMLEQGKKSLEDCTKQLFYSSSVKHVRAHSMMPKHCMQSLIVQTLKLLKFCGVSLALGLEWHWQDPLQWSGKKRMPVHHRHAKPTISQLGGRKIWSLQHNRGQVDLRTAAIKGGVSAAGHFCVRPWSSFCSPGG